jgi:antitoxin component of MazEF toxin-antitoxin module
MSKYIAYVRRVGGSHVTAISPEIIRALSINPGDQIEWERHGDIAILKFFRRRTTVTPAQAVEEQRAESP